MYQEEGTVKEKKYELDFLMIKKKKICPIEVKSSGYRTHKSFDNLAKKYPIKLQDKYIIYTKDLKFEDEILYIPIYMTMCLQSLTSHFSNGKIEGNFMHIHRDLCMKKNIRIVFHDRVMIDIYHNLAGRSEDAL